LKNKKSNNKDIYFVRVKRRVIIMVLFRRKERSNKLISIGIIILMVFSMFFIAIPFNSYNVQADYVHHSVGNLDLMTLTDWGSLGYPLKYKDVEQIAKWMPYLGHAVAGLVFDQADYNHGPASYGIADSVDSGVGQYHNDVSNSDFNVKSEDANIRLVIDDNTMQKSYCSFTQVGDYNVEPIGVSNDVRIHQTAWTLSDKDWAIIEWKVQNLNGSDLTDVNIGFMCWVTGNVNDGWQSEKGVGGDKGDDIDYWDSMDDIYYVRDDFGTGDVLGFSSAVPLNPFNHYYSSDSYYFGDDVSLYSALTGPSGLIGGPGGSEINALVSWNNNTIQTSSNMTFAMVIAYGSNVTALKKHIVEAQDFYYKETVGVHITEFQDSSSPSQRIEVFNFGDLTQNLLNWEFQNKTGASLTGNWIPDSILQSGDHRYLDVTSGILDPEGDIIYLYDNLSICIDYVAFGQFGRAPDPINGESASRIWNFQQDRYINEWTMTITGITAVSFGSRNNVPEINKDPPIVLNEVLFYNNTQEKFIEIWCISDGAENISDFRIIADSDYTIPEPILLSKYVPAYSINETTGSSLFSTLTASGDNIYLFNDTGVLFDMVGWNSTHIIDTTIKRIPDGNGTYDGYDDLSSHIAGWKFSQNPSPPSILIKMDQKKAGNINSIVSFNLTITNLKNDNDIVDIILVSSQPNNWSVTFLAGDGTSRPLTDTNGDPNGYVDIGLMKPAGLTIRESVNIFVNISIPSDPVTDCEFTEIAVQSSTNPSFCNDTVFLTTEVAPYINVNKTADPKTIFVENIGYPNEAQITLNLTGAGISQPIQKPQDTVFVIDSSASMFTNDPLSYRISGTKKYIDKMKDFDRAASVGFGHDNDYLFAFGAWLTQDMVDHPLGYGWGPHHFRNTDENNITSIKSDVDSLDWEGSSTNIELALQIALQELIPGYVPTQPWIPTARPFPPDQPGIDDGIRYGNSSHMWIIILLTDGIPSHPLNYTDDEVAVASANNVAIYTIGLGSGVNGTYLNQSIAQPTGGEYVYAAQAEDINDAYDKIRKMMISKIAGSAIPAQPMVTDIIPEVLTVNISSISPSPLFVGDDGQGNTMIQWEIDSINVSESWVATYNVSSKYLLLNQNVTHYPYATVDYLSWDDRIVSLPIPSDYISCIGSIIPPLLHIYVSPDKNDIILYWDPPPSPDIDHYLIYRAESQIGFDFSSVWIDTSIDNESNEASPIPLRTMWNDTNAARFGDSNFEEEYYYIIRAVNVLGEVSSTSRTVGKWTKTFQEGISTFSLPLEPIFPIYTDNLTTNMNADYIRYLDLTTHTWVVHNQGDGTSNNVEMILGQGYEVKFSNDTNYTFCGMPAAMINYDDDSGFIGFDCSSDAKNLTVIVEPNGDVILTWQEPSGIGINDSYEIYYSNSRDGFFGYYGIDYFSVCSPVGYGINSATHFGASANNPGARLYYQVVPLSALGVRGASTYSIGIWTEEYLSEYDTFGIPLRTETEYSADWYCDNIPDTVGINYFKTTYQLWFWHSTIMPEGAFDPILEMTVGYQISTSSTTKFTFIGI
jgi:hypothetical protein